VEDLDTERKKKLRKERLGAEMFSEDVLLGGLKAGPSWFISDHLLLMDSRNGNAEDVARQIADRNDLRCDSGLASSIYIC